MKGSAIVKSMAGVGVPALVLVIAMPLIADIYGVQRFGFIMLTWSTLGIASLLDLGVARALTHYVSKTSLSSVDAIWPAMSLGFFWAVTLGFLASYFLPIYFSSADKLPADLVSDLLGSVFWISLTVPLVVMFNLCRGVLEGLEAFGSLAFIKISTSVILLALMLSPLSLTPSASYAAFCFFCGRAFGLAFVLILMSVKIPFRYNKSNVSRLLSFGGWSSLSSGSSAVLVYIDRFVAGYFLSPIVYSTYSVMSDLCQRFLLIPGAVSSVLFQSASAFSAGDPTRLVKSAIYYVTIPMAVICITVFFWGSHILLLWLGSEFPFSEFDDILTLLLLGTFINAITHVPFSMLQGSGFVSLTGKLHLLELILFAPIFVLSGKYFGIHGIVLCWLARIVFDCLVMFILLPRVLRSTHD